MEPEVRLTTFRDVVPLGAGIAFVGALIVFAWVLGRLDQPSTGAVLLMGGLALSGTAFLWADWTRRRDPEAWAVSPRPLMAGGVVLMGVFLVAWGLAGGALRGLGDGPDGGPPSAGGAGAAPARGGPPPPSVDITGLPTEIEVLIRQADSSNLADVMVAAAPLLAPLVDAVTEPIADGLNLGQTILQHFAEAAAEEAGQQVVGRLFGLFDSDSLSDADAEPTPADAEWATVEEGSVLFEFGEAVVPISGQAEIGRLHAAADPARSLWILIGSTDRSGTETSNRALAQDRVDAVARYLLAREVNPYQIVRKPLSELGTPLPGSDGQKDPANRRTHIILLQFGQERGLSPREDAEPSGGS